MRLDLPDDIDPIAGQFRPVQVETRTLLNSVPKSGTHLLRNIVRMFIGNYQTYRPFAVDHDWHEHALGMGNPDKKFFCGHVNFGLKTLLASRDFNQVLLVRDPFDYVMSYARFFYSEEFQAPIALLLRREGLPFNAALSVVINGVYDPQYYFASVGDVYRDNAIKWLRLAHLVRYEDIIAAVQSIDEPRSELFLKDLLARFGILDLPDDWRERIRIGVDPGISATASHQINLPEGSETMGGLPEAARQEIEALYPGLRAALGYGSEAITNGGGERRAFGTSVENGRDNIWQSDQDVRSTDLEEKQQPMRTQ